MATLIEIADSAKVPLEGVLRVINGEPVSEVVAERVKKAIDTVGPPHPRLLEDMNLLASPETKPREVVRDERLAANESNAPLGMEDVLAPVRQELLETLSHATAELEASLPQGVVNVVYEALHVEVQPVTERMHHMGVVFEELTQVVRQLDSHVDAERRERFEDLKLVVELVATGWQTVDRRLGRIEQILHQLEQQSSRPRVRNGAPGPPQQARRPDEE
jgi:hypothetical protein